MTELEALLARATELEEKQAAVREDEDDWDDDLSPDAVEAAVVEAKLMELEYDGDDLMAVSSAPGEDAQADVESAGAEAFMPVPPVPDDLLDDDLDDPAELEAFADQLEVEAELDEEFGDDDDEEKGYDFDDLDDLVVLEEKGSGDGGKGKEQGTGGRRVTQEERDYVRDQLGKFASGGSSDSQRPAGGKDDEGDKEKLPADPDAYDLDRPADVRNLARAWGKVPDAARAALKKKMLAALRADDEDHPHLVAVVNGLGDGDGVKEEGEGAGAALRDGRSRRWVAGQEKGADFDDLEEKDGYVTLTELEVLQARRAQLDA